MRHLKKAILSLALCGSLFAGLPGGTWRGPFRQKGPTGRRTRRKKTTRLLLRLKTNRSEVNAF